MGLCSTGARDEAHLRVSAARRLVTAVALGEWPDDIATLAAVGHLLERAEQYLQVASWDAWEAA